MATNTDCEAILQGLVNSVNALTSKVDTLQSSLDEYVDEYLNRDNANSSSVNVIKESLLNIKKVVDDTKVFSQSTKDIIVDIPKDLVMINDNIKKVGNNSATEYDNLSGALTNVGKLLGEVIKYHKENQDNVASMPTSVLQSIVNSEAILRQINRVYLGGGV